jgi:hypothetical protein
MKRGVKLCVVLLFAITWTLVGFSALSFPSGAATKADLRDRTNVTCFDTILVTCLHTDGEVQTEIKTWDCEKCNWVYKLPIGEAEACWLIDEEE